MDKQIYASISATGKVVYTILCTETYALKQKPQADWTPLFERIWHVTSGGYWDEWSYEFTEIIPECIFEFPDYESSDLSYTSENEYKKLIALYAGMPESWGALLETLDRLVLILGYDCDDPEGEAAELVPAIESILAAEGISLPTEDLVSFFPISENRGYGNPFDGRQISHVLG